MSNPSNSSYTDNVRIHPPLKVLVDAQNKLGEGIVGNFDDDNAGVIAWVDIEKQEVHFHWLDEDRNIIEKAGKNKLGTHYTWGAADCANNIIRFFSRDKELEVAAHPIKDANDSPVYKTKLEESWSTKNFYIPDCPENHRTNDGRMHPSGKSYWFGTMAADDPTNNPTRGGIYWLKGMQAELIFPDIQIPNAICFSPTGERMYFTDSPTRIISRFPVDPETGAPTMAIDPEAWKDKNSPLRRSMIFIDLDDHLAHIPESSHPDGAITDTDGNIFLALACLDFDQPSSAVARFSPAGKLTDLYPVPTPVVTCPLLDAHGYLYATSAKLNMTNEQFGKNPTAGALWRTPYPVESAE